MLKYLLMRDLCVSIHSDDPAYCGGYISENYSAAQQALNLDSEEIFKLAANAIEASFLYAEEKAKLQSELNRICASYR
jgi:adenosine deaminase